MVILPVQMYNIDLRKDHTRHGRVSGAAAYLAQILGEGDREAVRLAVVKPLALTGLGRTHTKGNKN